MGRGGGEKLREKEKGGQREGETEGWRNGDRERGGKGGVGERGSRHHKGAMSRFHNGIFDLKGLNLRLNAKEVSPNL